MEFEANIAESDHSASETHPLSHIDALRPRMRGRQRGNRDIRSKRIVEAPTKRTRMQPIGQQYRHIPHWHGTCSTESIEATERRMLGVDMAATFQLKANDDGRYYFHFLDGRGELLMMSGDYPEKQAAEQAIQDVRVGSLMSEQLGAGQVPEGDSFFVIKNAQGDILVKSVLFSSRMVFDNALHAVRDGACIAEITDLT